MIDQPLQGIEDWVVFFSNAELPIMRQTARRLEEARAKIDDINGRDIAAIILGPAHGRTGSFVHSVNQRQAPSF